MKIFQLFAVIATGIFLLSFSGGFDNGGATGAPGESNACSQPGCHASGSFAPTLEIAVTNLDGEEVTGFLPGQDYNIQLTNMSDAMVPPSGYGFQLVCLDDADSPVNTFDNLPDGLRQFMDLGRQYVVQSQRLPVNTVTVPWTAPDASFVTFYSGPVAANANGNPGDDGGTSASLVLEQESTSTINAEDLELVIYPNPTQDVLHVTGVRADRYQVINTQGESVINSTSSLLDVSDQVSGLYHLRVITDNGVVLTKSFFKN